MTKIENTKPLKEACSTLEISIAEACKIIQAEEYEIIRESDEILLSDETIENLKSYLLAQKENKQGQTENLISALDFCLKDEQKEQIRESLDNIGKILLEALASEPEAVLHLDPLKGGYRLIIRSVNASSKSIQISSDLAQVFEKQWSELFKVSEVNGTTNKEGLYAFELEVDNANKSFQAKLLNLATPLGSHIHIQILDESLSALDEFPKKEWIETIKSSKNGFCLWISPNDTLARQEYRALCSCFKDEQWMTVSLEKKLHFENPDIVQLRVPSFTEHLEIERYWRKISENVALLNADILLLDTFPPACAWNLLGNLAAGNTRVHIFHQAFGLNPSLEHIQENGLKWHELKPLMRAAYIRKTDKVGKNERKWVSDLETYLLTSETE